MNVEKRDRPECLTLGIVWKYEDVVRLGRVHWNTEETRETTATVYIRGNSAVTETSMDAGAHLDALHASMDVI